MSKTKSLIIFFPLDRTLSSRSILTLKDGTMCSFQQVEIRKAPLQNILLETE